MNIKETLKQLSFWENEFNQVSARKDLPATRAAWLEKIGKKIAATKAELIFVC